MINPPRTVEEAKLYGYCKWAGNPTGTEYDNRRCAFEVWNRVMSHQCSKPNGHGPDDLYCEVHAEILKNQSA